MQVNSTQYFLSLIQYHTLQMVQHPTEIKMSDLRHLIRSKHQNLHQIFEVLRMHKYYFIVIRQLLIQIITDVYIQIDQKLEIHIIRCIWKQYILQLLVLPLSESPKDQHHKVIGFNPDLYQKIIMFLCQKMRSLKFTIRLQALNSFFQLTKCLIQNQKGLISQSLGFQSSYEFHKVLVDLLSDMIQKQELAKRVSFSRGIFLQLLEDQYHQLRKQTLAFLRQISVHTLYFGSPRSQIILKQTILYMLNDQHELVREQSLLDIRKISLFEVNLNKSANQRIFGMLNLQEVNTILMCLKQNRDILRQECYECLKWVGFAQIREIMTVLQKLYQTLLIYKQDKQKIYSLLLHYSYALKQIMVRQILQKPFFLPMIYQFNGQEEPNPKNIIYKGRILLMSQWYGQISKKLPFYFKRHLNYVQDLEICKLSKSNTLQSRTGYQRQDRQPNFLSEECQQHLFSASPEQLKAIIELQQSVASGIKKQLLKLLKNLLRIYTLLENNKSQLETQFQLENSDLLTSLQDQEGGSRRNIIRKILNQNWQRLSQISYTFSIKNNPILLDIISKIGHIWQNLFQDRDIDQILTLSFQTQEQNKLSGFSQDSKQKMQIQEKNTKFRYFYNYINFIIKITLENSFQKTKPYSHKIRISNTSSQKLMISLQSPSDYFENYWVKIKPQQTLLKQTQKQPQWLYVPLMSLKCLTNFLQRQTSSSYLQDVQTTQIFELQLKINSKYNNSFQMQSFCAGNQNRHQTVPNKKLILKQVLTPIKVKQVELIVIVEREQLKLADWRANS